MRRNTVSIVAWITFVAIIAAAIYLTSQMINNGSMNSDNNTTGQSRGSVVDKSSSTYKVYSDLVGEQYDRVFIANMIAHHEGAVDMAELALTNAKHQELKDMADNIISAQSGEIKNMLSWQSAWGYPSSSGDAMEDHSAMGMMGEMASMNEELKGLSGDEFDKSFLSLMIEHHQSAIDMAYPGMLNAYHLEVKTLTTNIVNTQSEEIAQMKQWQQVWGYK